jgi:type I restriction enzyme S subunit
MRTEKFKTLFDFGSKSNFKAGDGLEKGNFPFYTSSSILKKRIDKAQYFDDALIFGTGGSASVHFAGEPFATSTDCIVAITKHEDLNAKFVYYYLFGNIHLLERGFKGAGLKHISKKYIENLEIPILPNETQNKIVAVLDKASSLVTKREESIALLDELLRAIFLESFGDPRLNPLNFPVRLLSDFYIDKKNGTKCGPFGSALKKDEYTETGVPVWNMDNISKHGKFLPNPNLFINDEKFKELENYSVFNNDIIISRAGTVGKMCVVKSEFSNSIISTNLIRVRFNNDLLPIYFVALMLYCKGGIGRLQKGGDGAFTHMSTGILDSLEFPYPDINLQKKFEEKQIQFQEINNRLKISLSELDLLLKSIMQKVFNGELNFNIDLELDALIKEIDDQKKGFEEYSATDNDRTTPKPIENIRVKNKHNQDIKNTGENSSLWENKSVLGLASSIPFNATEGNAIFKNVFAKKTKGFCFDEFVGFVKEEGFTYDYLQLKEFIFNKLENKEIIQYYSNKEWRETNYDKDISPLQDDFAGDGKIYLIPNKIKK